MRSPDRAVHSKIDIVKISAVLMGLARTLFMGLPCKGQSPASPAAPFQSPPGTYTTSWVGNSFGGNGGPNGLGYWVQDGADEIKVTPDGTVVAGVGWDEAGRCIGLYKNGQVNRVLLKENNGNGKETAWGWGTANNALAVEGSSLYAANLGKKLMRFHWTPGDLDSAHFETEIDLPGETVGLYARNGVLAVVYKDSLELRRASDLSVTGRFSLPEARDVVLGAKGDLWALTGRAIRHLTADGKDLGSSVPGLEAPSALAWDNRGRLMVCENGARQQVLFYDVTPSTPRLVGTFGEPGGLLAGTPGLAAPKKLFALRGAGTDAQGNLYVAMSFVNSPNGNFVLRAFTPSGALRWERMATAFVDTFGFDPDADGSVVYGRTAVFDLDLMQTEPGREWKLRAFTIDPVHHADDSRIPNGCSTLVRHLQGRRLMYTIGQYAGGYRLFTFEEPNGWIAREVAQVGASEQWAWDVDAKGGIWHGDAPGKTIRYYAFRGWTKEGKPDYDWQHPQSWAWPEGWDVIRRIHYDVEHGTLYLTGYLQGQRVETWGVSGPTMQRYDNWLSGKPTLRWTNRDLPRDENPDPKEGPLTPQSVAWAGDYCFCAMVKPTKGRQVVHILRLSDDRSVGTLVPGAAVGTEQGWPDMPYAVQATRRRNGEYLILVEEDARAKNLLYRWHPIDSKQISAR